MNKTENRKDEFDLALENMKLEPEADLDRLIEKRVKQMMTRISLQVVCVVLLVLALVFLGVIVAMSIPRGRMKPRRGAQASCCKRFPLMWKPSIRRRGCIRSEKLRKRDLGNMKFRYA